MTTTIHECGCVSRISNSTIGLTIIDFCPLHKAAPELLEALEESIDWLENAPFDYKNGVTHMGADEGEYYGWKGHNEIVTRMKAIRAKAKGGA